MRMDGKAIFFVIDTKSGKVLATYTSFLEAAEHCESVGPHARVMTVLVHNIKRMIEKNILDK